MSTPHLITGVFGLLIGEDFIIERVEGRGRVDTLKVVTVQDVQHG